MKNIRLVDASGNNKDAQLVGEASVGNLISTAFVGGEVYRLPRYRYSIDGSPASWDSTVTENNNKVVVVLKAPSEPQ
jgi:hypothetical protein